jgi:hypothetical protein
MFAISTYVREAAGAGEFYNGALYQLPVELRDRSRIQQYAAINKPGWGKLEFGYWYYAHFGVSGDLFVFPGLILEGEAAPTKRFSGHRQKWSRRQIEAFASSVVKYRDDALDAARDDLDLLFHDLRALSNSIYNSALEASNFIKSGKSSEAEKRIESVIASQGMLRLRTDALDYAGNPTSHFRNEEISLFKKIDKVGRCF